MKLQNGGEYIESLRALNPIIYYKGKRIDDVTRHPATAPHVRAAAMTYSLAAKEEYRDLAITVAAFQRTLEQEEFKTHSAGIVLQAYLPDSYEIQKQLTQWAEKRVADGGSPIKLRIVKGANMEMELVESSINNWPLAPYDNKLEVDANYKRMVVYGMEPDRIRAVNLGIASHNLFELAFAYALGHHNQVAEHFYFEMLEGMADHVRRALAEKAGDVLLYAPVASKEEFINAIAYLVRRLDENTAPQNFLRYSPKLSPGSREWTFLKDQFLASCDAMQQAGRRPHRNQDRRQEALPEKQGTFYEHQFLNEPSEANVPGCIFPVGIHQNIHIWHQHQRSSIRSSSAAVSSRSTPERTPRPL